MSQLDQREEIFPILFTATNLIPDQFNNKYSFDFPQGGVKLDRSSKIALASIQMPNSIFNISAAYGNNTFSVIIPVGAGSTTLNITLPDGNYGVSDINSYIQWYLINTAANYYLIDSSGNNVFYIELVENAPRYAVQLNEFAIPTALPAGWSNPGGWALPTTTRTPQLVVSGGFATLIGFNAGTFPSPTQTTNYSKISDFTPTVNTVSSVIVLCSLITNNYSIPSNNMAVFTFAGVTFGDLLNYLPPQYSWVSAKHGVHTSIQIRFVDQNLNDVMFEDKLSAMMLVMSNSFQNVSS